MAGRGLGETQGVSCPDFYTQADVCDGFINRNQHCNLLLFRYVRIPWVQPQYIVTLIVETFLWQCLHAVDAWQRQEIEQRTTSVSDTAVKSEVPNCWQRCIGRGSVISALSDTGPAAYSHLPTHQSI